MELNKIPKPFCFNPNKIKAFVLGCDPTNFSDNGKRQELHYVFGIGQDERYFRDILKNLKLIGLHLEDLYIQNLVKEYQEEETSKNKNWEIVATKFLSQIITELDKLDPIKRIPVFLTAERLYRFLMKEDKRKYSAEELYNLDTTISIPSNENKLNRQLIPLSGV